MPTYDYACSECGRHFQIFHAMSAEPPRQCSEARRMAGRDPEDSCDGAVERQLTGGTGLIFKGSGFYITDYKDKPGAKGGEGDKKGGESKKSDGAKDSSGDSAGDSTSDAKPAAAASSGDSKSAPECKSTGGDSGALKSTSGASKGSSKPISSTPSSGA